MSVSRLTRRSSLLLPLAFAACGAPDQTTFDPLRWDYLPPIQLNVLTVDIEQRFFPSGSGDLTAQAPVRPADALKTMGEDRLRPFGNAGRAVMAIQDASLIKRDGAIVASMAVTVSLYRETGERGGFIEARVSRRETGGSGSMRSQLYQLVKSMMDQMNVELEFQIRRNLKEFLVEATAAPTAVEQAPLSAPKGTPLAPPSGGTLRMP